MSPARESARRSSQNVSCYPLSLNMTYRSPGLFSLLTTGKMCNIWAQTFVVNGSARASANFSVVCTRRTD